MFSPSSQVFISPKFPVVAGNGGEPFHDLFRLRDGAEVNYYQMRKHPILFLLVCGLAFAQTYDGPRPPKKDMIYIVHADNLIPTETGEAQQEGKKNDPVYTFPGASSPARTPLAEPIFILDSDAIKPDSVELYRMDVKSGHREVKVSGGSKKSGNKALRLSVTKLDRGLYKLEAAETLDPGEYSLSPTSGNHVFCFEVY
jgi:hypothetical protein